MIGLSGIRNYEGRAYSVDLVTRQAEQKEPENYKYSVMLKIEMVPGTMDEMVEQHGRAADQQPSRFPGMPVHRSGQRGVIVLKVESNPGTRGLRGGETINDVILSKTPSDPDDPIFKINSRIRRISVVGRVGAALAQVGIAAAGGGGGGGE